MDGPIIGYARVSDNLLMWPQGPIYKFWPKKCFFLPNFTRILWFFWDMGLTLFDIPKDAVFSRNFGFKQYFEFSGSKLGPDMNENYKRWVLSIWAKIQNFERFFKHCFCLIGRIPMVKISARLNNILGSKVQKHPKKTHFVDAE